MAVNNDIVSADEVLERHVLLRNDRIYHHKQVQR